MRVLPVTMTHIVYNITFTQFALFPFFVLCDRIGADSLSLLFSQTSLGCLSLNLCCAVAYYDSGVI